ncbi:hypothetical protein [Adlercreutzia sp. ZJ141]|uniref:hypothetical protein n=1 Tax=Adlercreutzia sp. ZJ141 TaxID=2709406 RepID=UPI0013EDF459|nr:hypothetical protein [Adlercreutzia sp. ZJ141]
MCVIVFKPEDHEMPTRETLLACWEHNPDGAGIMYPAAGGVRTWKGFMEWADFERALDELERTVDLEAVPVALHFRIATHGGVKPGCCHPFAVCKDYKLMRKTDRVCKLGFMHNGTLSGLDTRKGVSDSMAFAANVLLPLTHLDDDPLSNKWIEKVIASSTQGSRFLLMNAQGSVSVFGDWSQVDGILYSNLNHVRYTYSGCYGQPSLFDAFMGFGGDQTDLLDYGLYEACANCELLDECMTFAPYCATSEEAESMAEYALPR